MAGPAREQQQNQAQQQDQVQHPDQARWWPHPARARQAAAAVTAAALLAAVWLRFGASPVLPAFGYLAVISAPLAFIDVAVRRLPDALTLPSYPAALLLLGAAALASHGGTRHLIMALAGLAAVWVLFVLQALDLPGRDRLGRREAVRGDRAVPGLVRGPGGAHRADRRATCWRR